MRATMLDDQVLVPRARASGAWQGVAVEGEARIRLHQRGIVLAWHDGRSEWRVPFTDLSGFALRTDALVLYGASGSVSLTSQDRLNVLWQALFERACALPELARGARTVGSRRGGDPSLQARFFGPVLDARRRAELQDAADRKVTALDGATIAAQVTQILAGMAQARWPHDLPEQRALGAELEECCEGLFAACDALTESARAWLAASDERHLDAWREWVAAAAQVFAASDRAWGDIVTALASAHHVP